MVRVPARGCLAFFATLSLASCYTPVYDEKIALGLKNGTSLTATTPTTPTTPFDTVATPLISPAPGSYDSDQGVAITSATPLAKIYYTADGSDPISPTGAPTSGSSLYIAGALTIHAGQTITIKAAATKTGMNPSSASQSSFHVRSWVLVGSSNFTGGDITTPSLAIAADGTPYIGFADAGTNVPCVMYLNGADWSYLGVVHGFASISVLNTSLAMSSGSQPYIAFYDGSNGGKISAFDFTGTWNQLGVPGFSNNAADLPSIALDPGDIPYVGYFDTILSKAVVKKFFSPSWVTVGSASGFSPGAVSYLSLAIAPSGKPYLGFRDDYFGYKASVMSYDGSSWNFVGSEGFNGG